MGVRGLMPLLARFAPKCITMPTEQELSRWTVAVDSNIYVQRFFRGTDGGSDESRHLRGMRSMANYLRTLDVTPLFVFDGRTRALGKESELSKRREDRMRIVQELERENTRAQRIRSMSEINAHMDGETQSTDQWTARKSVTWLKDQMSAISNKKKSRQVTIDSRMDRLELETSRLLLFRLGGLNSLNDTDTESLDCAQSLRVLQTHSAERIATLNRRTEHLSADMITQCEVLLRALGFATHVVDDWEESEGVCSQLYRAGVVDAVCSEDLDVVALGARLLRGLYSFDARSPMALVDAQKACEELGLSRESFVDLCILCGTDFASTLEKVGPITALRLVREHGSIERILETEPFVPRPSFNYELARTVFLADPELLPFETRAQLKRSAGYVDPAIVEALLPSGTKPGGKRPTGSGQTGSDPFANSLVLD
ncbi:hypothetical protein IWW56_004796 [Coemansia sp. RSA 2131]|nr:hypothetical protein IWW56_004796 [Coemansia sp. RSA 2131]